MKSKLPIPYPDLTEKFLVSCFQVLDELERVWAHSDSMGRKGLSALHFVENATFQFLGEFLDHPLLVVLFDNIENLREDADRRVLDVVLSAVVGLGYPNITGAEIFGDDLQCGKIEGQEE